MARSREQRAPQVAVSLRLLHSPGKQVSTTDSRHGLSSLECDEDALKSLLDFILGA